MAWKYPDITAWLAAQHVRIDDDYDNIHLVTGEEGFGKSLWMRKVARKLDPTFTLDRIHFEQDDYLDQASELPKGSCIILDEYRGHRRLAMTGDRLEFLDFLKECRGMNLHQFIGYPHVNQFEKDILNDRIRYWEDIPRRGLVDIFERKSERRFRKGPTGPEPYKHITWPQIAKFPVTVANDPLRIGYLAKKEARMRDRRARFLQAHGKAPEDLQPRRLDWGAVDGLLDELRRNQPAP